MPLLLIAIAVVAVIGVGTYVVTKEDTDSPLEIQTEAIARPEESTETEVEVVAEPEDEPEPVAETPAEVEVAAPAAEPVVSTPAPAVIEEVPAPAPVVATTFVDGTYNTEVSYLTPSRKSHDMVITLSVENDVVTKAAVTYDGISGPSNSHHKRFDTNYQSGVVGVALDEISLSRVGGASLTTNAFNEAVTNIEAKARS